MLFLESLNLILVIKDSMNSDFLNVKTNEVYFNKKIIANIFAIISQTFQ